MIILSFILAILLLYILNCFQKQEIERLHIIIKEVREYIKTLEFESEETYDISEFARKELLEILDKEK